ncbi:hypothetical protein K491DRAFT_720522 [Lophiostoma macrostomum CBS 122681]|uniref:Uncharacterized protein n=1 Tax=Lophiostoma macrostomum CBS 122681 TaxID=1314788 RepID=A0A6A6SWB0_9PLEO|nr:hypothetical protein K491DRAFT_720522 [Lophiostoma macrostomum CBS 122681]
MHKTLALTLAAAIFERVQSVAVNTTLAAGQKAIIPTKSGQIGINPITDIGDVSQYQVEPRPTLIKVDGTITEWIGPSEWTEAAITRTVGSEVETATVPVLVSVSKATASSNGQSPGDVTVTFVDDGKKQIESFADEVLDACKAIAAKFKRVKRDRDMTLAAEGVEECIFQKATEATAPEGELESLFENANLEIELPDVPAGPSAEIDKWAGILQIAKNQVRRKGAWLVVIILTTGFTEDGVYRWSYNVPANPAGVEETPTPTPTSTAATCNSAVPTGTNASVTMKIVKECQIRNSASWASGNINQVIDEIAAVPDDENTVECGLGVGDVDFNGTIYSDPHEWCLCGKLFKPHNSFYPTLTSTTSLCAYNTLPPTQISIQTTSKPTGGAITSCRSYTADGTDGPVTSCTCNDNNGYPFRGSAATAPTPSGCDWIVTATSTSTMSANLGMATCMPNVRGGARTDWFMRQDSAQYAIKKYCNSKFLEKLPMGPGQNRDRVDGDTTVAHYSWDAGQVYFYIKYLGGREDCPVLDIGGKDGPALCEDIYMTIINTCDPVKSEDFWKQGGRFERDCYQWEVTKGCNINSNDADDCIFK